MTVIVIEGKGKKMAILIENMKMPNGCVHCKLLHGMHRQQHENGKKTLYVGCRLKDEWNFVDDSGRRADCPLKEVKVDGSKITWRS